MKSKIKLYGTITFESVNDIYNINQVDEKYSVTSKNGYGRYDIVSLNAALKIASNRIVVDKLDSK